MSRIILVTGGVRSGKSSFAQQLAEQIAGEAVLFVATAHPGDEDMSQRIAVHRQNRPAAWRTLEVPHQVAAALRNMRTTECVILLDCLTLLTSNCLLADGEIPDALRVEQAIRADLNELIQAVESFQGTLIVVTNEVGLGVVPPSLLGRLFRDVLGRANQWLAARADEVFLLVAGLPIDVKRLARKPEKA